MLKVCACFQLRPDHRPQSSEPIFSRSYGSGLPTSLTYIVLSIRGCSPWRPAAVMGTTWRCESLHSSPRFSGPASATPDVALYAALYGAVVPISDPVGFRQTRPLQRKDYSSRGSGQRLRALYLRSSDSLEAVSSAFRFENIDPIPFRPGGAHSHEAGLHYRSERNFPRP